MTDDHGVSWFETVFLPSIEPERPQLLIQDALRSHESLGLIEEERQKQERLTNN